MDKALRDKGLANRKAVLGEDYVNRSMAAADSFNGPFQEILNEYCWGMIWSDERLPKKTRSMLNLVMLACLNRMHEWELHLKGALTNGVTRDEVQAILHQIAIYAGVPLGVECFRAARKVFAEIDKKGRWLARLRLPAGAPAVAPVVRQAPGGDCQGDGNSQRRDDELRFRGREKTCPARQPIRNVRVGLQGLHEGPVLGVIRYTVEERHAQEGVARARAQRNRKGVARPAEPDIGDGQRNKQQRRQHHV